MTAPVRKDFPAGTTTCPPPALLHAAIALVNAALSSVFPSPLAPNAVTSKFRSGNVGGLIRPRITGTWSQGEAVPTAGRCVAAQADRATRPAVPAPAATRPPATSRFRRVYGRVMAVSPRQAAFPAHKIHRTGAACQSRIRPGEIGLHRFVRPTPSGTLPTVTAEPGAPVATSTGRTSLVLVSTTQAVDPPGPNSTS